MIENRYVEPLEECVQDAVKALEVDYELGKQLFRRDLLAKKIEYDEVTPLPTSFLPRIIPNHYVPVIRDAARAVLEAMFGLLAHPRARELLHTTGINAFLIDEHRLLDYVPERMIGSARLDFGVYGPLVQDNFPRLFEINALDYGGGGWNHAINKSLFKTLSYIIGHTFSYNLGRNIGRNMRKVGQKVLMLTSGCPTDSDYTLFMQEAAREEVSVVAIEECYFEAELRRDHAVISPQGIRCHGQEFDSLYLRALSSPEELTDFPILLRAILNERPPLYDSHHGMLVENKSLLQLLSCDDLVLELTTQEQQRILRQVRIPTYAINNELKARIMQYPERWVVKENDAHLGKGVHMAPEDIREVLAGMNGSLHHFSAQERVFMNWREVDPGTRFTGRASLDVYVTYEWHRDAPPGQRIQNDFAVAGFLTRASQNPIVNVARGGCLVPTLVQGPVETPDY